MTRPDLAARRIARRRRLRAAMLRASLERDSAAAGDGSALTARESRADGRGARTIRLVAPTTVPGLSPVRTTSPPAG